MSDATQCELCEKNPSEYSCEACDMDQLCAACDADLHRNAKQATHRRKHVATGEYVQIAATAAGTPAASPSNTAESVAASPTASDGGNRRGGLGLQSGSLRHNLPRPSINLLAPRPAPHGLLGAIHEHGGAAPSKIKNRASVTLAFQVLKGEQITPAAVEAAGSGSAAEPFVKMCDICSSAPAAQYCPQCQRFSCMECDHTTHKSSAMKGHARMPYPPVFNKTPSGPTSPISEASDQEESAAAAAAPQLSVAIESPSNAISIIAPSPLSRSGISPALAALAAQPRAALTVGAAGGGRNARAMSVMAPVSSKPLIQLPVRTGGASGSVSASAVVAATPAPICDICEDSAASVWCSECKMNLCVSNNCDQELHTPAKTKSHVRTPLGEALKPFATDEAATKSTGENAATAAAAASTTPPASVANPVDSPHRTTAAAAAASTLSTPAAVAIAASSLLSSPQLPRPRASSVMLTAAPLALPKAPGGAGSMLNLPSTPQASSTHSSLHTSPNATARTARGSRLCEICEAHPAVLYCAACPMYMCSVGGCDAQLHAPAKLAHHFRAPMPKAKCSICEEQEGDVWCFDCSKHYCSASHCDRDYHQPAKNAAHKRESVRALHAVDPTPAVAATSAAVAAAVPEPKMNIVVTPEEATPLAAVPSAAAVAATPAPTKPATPPTAAAVSPEPPAAVAAPVVAPAIVAPVARVFPQGAAVPAKPAAAVVTPPATVAAAVTPVASTPAAVVTAAPAGAAPAAASVKKSSNGFASLLGQLLPSTTPVAAPKSNIFVVCDLCDVALAALLCEACRAEESVVVEQFFCVSCDKKRHATASKREAHRRRAILKTDTERPVDPLVKAAASVARAIPDIAAVLAQSPHQTPQSSPPMSRKASPRRKSGVAAAAPTTGAIVPSPILAVAAPVLLDHAHGGGAASKSARNSFSSSAVSVVQSLPECDRCSKAKATLYCEDCELNLDAACFGELHKSSAAKLHPKKNLVEHSKQGATLPAAIVPVQAPSSLLLLNLAEPPKSAAVVVPVVAAQAPVVVTPAKAPAAQPKKPVVSRPASATGAKPTAVPRAASTTTKAVEEYTSASPVLAPASSSPPKAAAVKPKPKVPVQAKPAAAVVAVAAPAEAKENGSDAAPVPVIVAKPKPAVKKPAASPAATPAASPTNAVSSAPVPVAAVAAAVEPVVAPQLKTTVSVTSEALPPIVVAAAPAAVAAAAVLVPAATAAAPSRSKSPAIPKLNLATPALVAIASAAPLHPSALLPAPSMSARSDTSADSSSSSSSSSDDESARKKRATGHSKKKLVNAAKPQTAAAGAPGPAAHHHHHHKSEDFAVDDMALLTARSAAVAKQKKAEAKAEAKAKVRAIVEAKHAAEAAAAAPVDPASKLASLEKSLQSRVTTLEHSLQESVQLKSARIHSARTEAIISTPSVAAPVAPLVVIPPTSSSAVSDTPEAMAAIRMELFNARTQLAQFQQLAHALSFQLQFGAAAGGAAAGAHPMHHPMAGGGHMGAMWPFMMNMTSSPSHAAAAAAASSPLSAAGPLPPKLSMLSSLPAPFQMELQELVASTVQATLAASPSHMNRAPAMQGSARSEEEFDPYAASRMRAKYSTINDSVHEAERMEKQAAERASVSAPEMSRPATAHPASSSSSSSSMLSHHSGTSTPIKATRLSSAPSSGGSGLTAAQLQAREAARAKMGATAPAMPLAFDSSSTPASVSLSALPVPSSKKMIVPRRRSIQSSDDEREAGLGTSETETDRSSLQDAEVAASRSKRRLAPLVSRPASASSLRSALKHSSSRPHSRGRTAADGGDSTADENDAVVFLAPSGASATQKGAKSRSRSSRSRDRSTADWSEQESDQEQFEAEIAAGDDDGQPVSSATSSLIARYREEAIGAMRGTPSSRKSPQHQSPARLKPINNSQHQQQQHHSQQHQHQQHHESSPSDGHSRSLSSDRRRAREEKRNQSLEAQLQLERAFRAEEAARNVTLRAALRSLQYEKEEAVSAAHAAKWVSRQADDDAREDAEIQRRAQFTHAQIDHARWESPPSLPTARTLSKLMQAQLYASTQPARDAQLLAHRRSASSISSPLDDFSSVHYRSPPMPMRSHELGLGDESSVNAYYQQQAAAQHHQAQYLAQLHCSPLQHQQQPHQHHHHQQQPRSRHHRGHLSHSASAGSLQAMMRSASPTRTGSSPQPQQQSVAQRAMERVYSAATLPVFRPTVKSPKPTQGGWM